MNRASSTGPPPPDRARRVPDVFTPARLGPLRLRNRILKAATFEGMTRDALVSPELIDFHVRHAAGGVAMTTVAYCAVAPEGRTSRHQILWRPEALPGLRRLTEAVHAQGAAVAAQIGHAGPVADPKSNRLPALAPSRTFNAASLRFARAAHRTDIDRIVAAHARAAVSAAETGFDAVEIHLGHDYLAGAFLSPRINRRGDAYGGPLENRARFARAVARAVREAVGDRLAILAKITMDDGVRGGFRPEDAAEVARWLEHDGSVDALELSAGSSLLNPMYLFRGDAPLREFAAAMPQPVRAGVRVFGRLKLRRYPYREAYLLDAAKQVRAAVGVPLVLLGGITGRSGMDLAMREGFEFVAMARALLREPDLPDRIRHDADTVSTCVHCNKCMVAIYSGTRCVLDHPEPIRVQKPLAP